MEENNLKMSLALYIRLKFSTSHVTKQGAYWKGWLVDSYRPGKQFFSHVGMGLPLPGYYQYFLGSKCALLKDTTRFDPSGARTPDLWIRSPRH